MTTQEPCGCRVEHDNHPSYNSRIIYCPTHREAFNLLAAAKLARDEADIYAGRAGYSGRWAYKRSSIDAAITNAEEES